MFSCSVDSQGEETPPCRRWDSNHTPVTSGRNSVPLALLRTATPGTGLHAGPFPGTACRSAPELVALIGAWRGTPEAIQSSHPRNRSCGSTGLKDGPAPRPSLVSALALSAERKTRSFQPLRDARHGSLEAAIASQVTPTSRWWAWPACAAGPASDETPPVQPRIRSRQDPIDQPAVDVGESVVAAGVR